MRGVTVVTLVLLVAVSYGLYRLKYRVEDQQNQAADITAQIEEDQRSIKVLRAEWAYLTRPQRLQNLSEEFLRLEPLKAPQVGDLDDIPRREPELPDVPEEPSGEQVSQVRP